MRISIVEAKESGGHLKKFRKHSHRFQPASDESLLVYLDDNISLEAHKRVIRLLRLLTDETIFGVLNLQPAYCSLLVKFDPLQTNHEKLESILEGYVDRIETVLLPPARLMEIPVCYGGDFGPDLAGVASLHKIPAERVVELHTSVTYLTYFLGFVPGFAYLGALPKALVTPRLSIPRRNVPAGSLGIAGRQTGIYPLASPGGWRLIGRTPLKMFQPNRRKMSLLEMGDKVRFRPISPDEFATLESK